MPKPLRIVQVINVRWHNATAWYGLFLSRLLKEAGHKVLVLGLPGTASFQKAQKMGLAPLGLNLNSSNPFVLMAVARKLRRALGRFAPDVVNCHRGEGLLFWGMLKLCTSRFVLVRTRGDQRAPKGNLANRYLHAHVVDAVIATNSHTAEQCRSLLGVPESRLYLIPGGVDTRLFSRDTRGRALVRQKYALTDDDFLVGLLGRFDPVKGHEDCMRALATVKNRLSLSGVRGRIRLMFLGYPVSISVAAMRDMMREYSFADDILLAEQVENVPAYLSAMDLGVIASRGSEAIARAAFEIMACGVPLVGTDVGVMPDLLCAEALAPAGEQRALTELLLQVIQDFCLRQRLEKEQGRRMLMLTHRVFLEQTLKVYHEVLRHNRGAS